MLTLTYITLAILGCGYILVTALTGHLLDVGAGDGGAGGTHAGEAGGTGAYGVDAAGHGSTSAADLGAASFHFPFFSPLALATLFAAIGAYGLITRHALRVADGPSLLISIPLAMATAYGVTYVGWRVMQGSRGSSQIRLADLVGAPGEVLTPIPTGGVGEVAAIVRGQRYTGPAREASGREVPRGAAVTVVRAIGTTLVVAVEAGGRARAEGGRPNV